MKGLQSPLFGRLVRRSRLSRIACEALSGNETAIAELCDALDTGDRKTVSLARDALSALPEGGQDVCCSLVISRESRPLAELCREQGYVPRDPADRAIFFLLSGQFDALGPMDDVSLLVARAYHEAPWDRRVRIIHALSTWGRPELLLEGLIDLGVPAAEVPGPAWDLIARRIAATGDYEILSQLIFSAPLSAAFTITGILKGAGFLPPDGDPEYWGRLYTAMPETFTYPEPAIEVRSTLSGGAVHYSRGVMDPTGRFVAACYEGTIELRKLAGGDPVSVHHIAEGSILAAACSPDGRWVALGGSGGKVFVVQLPGGQLAGIHDIGISAITSLSFTPDSRCIACGGQSGGIILLRLQDGRFRKFTGHPAAAVTCLAVTASGTIFSGHEDGSVWSWSSGTHSGTHLCPDHQGPVLFLFSSPGGILATASAQGPFLLRDIHTGSIAGRAGGAEMAGTAFAASQSWVAVGDAGGMVTLYTVPDGTEIRSYEVHRSGVSALCASPGGDWCAAGSRSGMVRILPVRGQETPIFFRGQTGSIRHLSASVPGSIVCIGRNGTLEVRRTDNGTVLLRTEGRGPPVTCISTDSTHRLLAVAGPARGIHLWDLAAREYRGTLETYTPGITAVVVLSCGDSVAVAGSDGSLRLIRVRDGTIIRDLRGHTGSLTALAPDPSSSRLAAGGWDGTIFIHDLEQEKSPLRLQGHVSPVTSLSFSPDGRNLASTSQDRTARIWDMVSGTVAAVLAGHRHVVSASAFSPDGSLLATGSRDTTIRLWSVPDGASVTVLKGHRDRISRLVFAGSRLLASGDEAGTVGLWTVPDGLLIRFFESNAGRVTGLLPIGDGRELLTTHEAGYCVFRDLPWTKIPAECTPDDYVLVREYLGDAAGAGGVDLRSWQWVEALLSGSLRAGIALCPDPPLAGGYEIELAGGG